MHRPLGHAVFFPCLRRFVSFLLTEKVGDDPVTVKLKFEPKNRPTTRKDYYLQDKENICVVCGAREDYVRKLVVPQEYRKYVRDCYLVLCLHAFYADCIEHIGYCSLTA